MKTLITILFLTPFVLISQYQFKVSVELSNANKNTISLLDNHIETTNRFIDGNIISFATRINYSEQYIDSVFVLIDVPPFLVVKDKIPYGQIIEKAGGNNCELAEILCSNANVSGVSGGFGTQELNNSNNGCLGVEHQSSWYYVNIQTGGVFNFTIDPNGADDYDFALWGAFTSTTANANCPPITDPIRCSYAATYGNTGLNNNTTGQASEGALGNGIVSGVSVSANEIYILMIDNFSASNQGYNLSFGGTATLGCTPVVLPVELLSFKGQKGAKSNKLVWEIASENNCNYYTVERSTDGENWRTIVNIPANNSDVYITYDDEFKEVINYYRLSQTDLNGDRVVYEDNLVSIDNRTGKLKVISVTNLLGQEVNDTYSGVVIWVYEDGSTVKKIQ